VAGAHVGLCNRPDCREDDPWTREELLALAWERIKHEALDVYDLRPEWQSETNSLQPR
jgi:hypothetical protein